VLELGTVDAAYDARGRSATEVTRYFSGRFGLPPDHPDPVREILRRKPPACIVIDGADRAEDPGALLREVLRPLAVGARPRGVRLVLGFDGPVPDNLPYEVSLDPEPIDGGSSRWAVAVDVGARIAELAAAEVDAATVNAGNERRFRKPPPLPPARAPRLRVRLAVAGAARHDPELAAMDEAAVAALGEIASFRQRSERMVDLLDELRSTLDVNQVRAARHLPEEDEDLADRYARARRALWQAPIDLDAAGRSVARYVADVDRRIRSHGRAGDKVEGADRG